MHFHTCLCYFFFPDGFLLCPGKYILILLVLTQGHFSVLLSNFLFPLDSNLLGQQETSYTSYHLLCFHSVCHIVSAQLYFSVEQGLANFFLKSQDSKFSLSYNYPTLPLCECSPRKYVNEWMWLFSNKTLFTKTGVG